ncbi:MAG: hypothetical protein AAB334_02045 [Patescibacteria group bacterium]
MGTLKNIQTRFAFWLYKNLSICTIWMIVFLFLTGIFFIFTCIPNMEIKQNVGFIYVLPFVFVIVVSVLILYVWTAHQEENYLIAIDGAEKLRERICHEGKMTGEISAKLSILVAGTLSKKDPKDLNAWINNFQVWEKYQRDLIHKKYLLVTLPNEISEVEKNVKILWDGLMCKF